MWEFARETGRHSHSTWSVQQEKKKAQTNEGFPQCRIPDGSWDACERKSLCLPAREVAEFAFKRVHSGRVACV